MGLRALATVGTTQFPALTDHLVLPSTLIKLRELGITSLRIQHGSADMILPERRGEFPQVTAFAYTESFGEEIEKADIVIGHAGAGTVVEVVGRGKKLVVVVNAKLMNNHQVELAMAVEERGCCVVVVELEELVEKVGKVVGMKVGQMPKKVDGVLAAVLAQELG